MTERQLEDCVTVEVLHKKLICRLCTVAVRPGKSAENHFRQQHKIKGQLYGASLTTMAAWSYEEKIQCSGHCQRMGLRSLRHYQCIPGSAILGADISRQHGTT